MITLLCHIQHVSIVGKFTSCAVLGESDAKLKTELFLYALRTKTFKEHL